MNSAPSDGTILVGCFGNVAWIRVEGKGSSLNSPQLKKFGEHAQRNGLTQFVVDLENCPALDSTFMGTLAALVLSLQADDPAGQMEVINATGRTRETLGCLGLDCLFSVDDDGSSWQREREQVAKNLTKPLPPVDISQRERGKLMLEAHEALVEANEENISQFRDVLDFLRRELDEGES
jgi:anti-anti-sigma regulatory factor